MITIEVYHAKDEFGASRLFLKFPFDLETKERIKQIPGRRYHSERREWSIPFVNNYKNQLLRQFPADQLIWREEVVYRPKEISNIRHFNPIQLSAIMKFERAIEMLGYSLNTLRTYKHMFKEYLNFYSQSDPQRLTEEEIRTYLHYLVRVRKVSRSYQNQSINAIKFFYEKILGQDRKVYYIERPKKEIKYPVVLSIEEVKDIFLQIRNFKHRIAMMLIYSAGLRRSELIDLKISDIDFHRNQIWIRGGKGLKDRYSLLAESLKPDLEEYLRLYRPKEYIIEGQSGDQYSAGSLRNILQDALKKTNIRKKVTLHTLRHSFATHMLEAGTATRYIQDLLGHSSPKTTEIYTHITNKGRENLKSPLDDWE